MSAGSSSGAGGVAELTGGAAAPGSRPAVDGAAGSGGGGAGGGSAAGASGREGGLGRSRHTAAAPNASATIPAKATPRMDAERMRARTQRQLLMSAVCAE